MNAINKLEPNKPTLGHKMKSWFSELYRGDRNKKYLTIGLLSFFGVIVLVGVIGLVWYQNTQPSTRNADAVFASKPGTEIVNVISADPKSLPASIIIAPASEDWWKKLQPLMLNPSVKAMDFSKISSGAEYIAITTTEGSTYGNYAILGLPTVVIVYKDSASASAVASTLVHDDNMTHGLKGNILVLAPGTASPYDYNLAADEYSNDATVIASNDLPLNNQAVMFLSSSAIRATLVKNFGTNDSDSFLQGLFNLLGISDNTSWYGTSTDAIQWSGTFNNLKFNSNLDLQQIVDYVKNATTITLSNGTVIPYKDATQDQIQNATAQGTLGYFLWNINVTTRTESAGQVNLNVSQGTYQWNPPLGDNNGIARIVLNPNELVAVLRGDVDTTYNATGIDYIDIKILDVSGKSTIKIAPYDPTNTTGTGFIADPWPNSMPSPSPTTSSIPTDNPTPTPSETLGGQ